MSWRPGEVWLDADVLWARGGGAVAAAAGVELTVPADVGPPPGLLASRERRAAWRGRRKARRARTTALVVSPALLVSLASLKGEQIPVGRLLADDPPTATYRAGNAARPAPIAAVRDRGDATASRRRAQEAAPAVPVIAWRHATSLGSPSSGRLVDGTQLPIEGPGWTTWSPVTDSAPNAPDRLYGHERVIRAIVTVVRGYRDAHPAATPVLIGDISRKGGGPMTDEHASHQNGLDVDVYLPRRDGTRRAATAPDQVDRRLAQDLLDRFLAAGAQVVFVGYSSGLHGPAGAVVPYRGHEYHLHVRFSPPGSAA